MAVRLHLMQSICLVVIALILVAQYQLLPDLKTGIGNRLGIWTNLGPIMALSLTVTESSLSVVGLVHIRPSIGITIITIKPLPLLKTQFLIIILYQYYFQCRINTVHTIMSIPWNNSTTYQIVYYKISKSSSLNGNLK